MTSLMTNVAAMTALQTLQATNSAMESTQNRIATGYRVSSASDNAAYWSIATTMRSDQKALSAVTDALGIGAATVDTAYTAMESVKDVLDEIKSKLTTATGENVDKEKVQGEISALQSTLKSIAGSASFSGQNYLSVDGSGNSKIIGSFARGADGVPTLGSIEINTAKTALFNASATESGLLEQDTKVVGTGGLSGTAAANNGTGTVAAFNAYTFSATGLTFDSNDSLSFDISLNGAAAKTIKITAADLTGTTTPGTIATNAEFATVLQAKLTAASVTGITATAGTGTVQFNDTAQTGAGAAPRIAITNVVGDNGGNKFDATTFTIVGANRTQIDTFINGVDKMLKSVTGAAAELGSVKNRIDMQTDFTSKLMDTIDKGIGTLVDADMTEESTKLKALQTQQQLGVQALSMANSSSQSLLSLFR